jgi:hypothetical protein
MVTLVDENIHGRKGLQFALQVLCDELDTTVVPVVLFDWRNIPPFTSFAENNETAAAMLNDITQNFSSNHYLKAVRKMLTEAVCRLITEGLAEKERNKESNLRKHFTRPAEDLLSLKKKTYRECGFDLKAIARKIILPQRSSQQTKQKQCLNRVIL